MVAVLRILGLVLLKAVCLFTNHVGGVVAGSNTTREPFVNDHTPYGLAESGWTIKERQIENKVVIPPNTTASVTLPWNEATPIEVGSGTHHWSYPYPLSSTLVTCTGDFEI
jgi:hypothetical protein